MRPRLLITSMPTKPFSFTLEQALTMAHLSGVDHCVLMAILSVTSTYAGIHTDTDIDMEAEARRVIASSPTTIDELISRFEWCHFMRFKATSMADMKSWEPTTEPYMNFRGRTHGRVKIEKIDGPFDTKYVCKAIWENQLRLFR